MKGLLSIFITLLFFVACKKDSFTTASDASLVLSSDTLKFDTVFTTVGSVTQMVTIKNDNDQKLRLSGIQLMGGTVSSYQLNIDGRAATSSSNLELAPNDSLYIFVKLTVNPTTANLPFIIRDSIKIDFNGQTRFVQLQAYGQNARFLRNQRITGNVTWDNQLPYVILGGLTIDSFATLTIGKGTRVYCNANSPILVNGTLRANGGKSETDRITFCGDRMDAEYRDYPGAWPGIIFNNFSRNNSLNFSTIKNAYQAITTIGGATNATPKLVLNSCIIDNAYDIGLYGIYSSVVADNCLFSNCGNDATLGVGGSNILLSSGGNYVFNYATVVTYANLFNSHKQPVVYVSDDGLGGILPLNVAFNNSVIYGEGGQAVDEIVTSKKGTNFTATLNNVLYKVKNDPSNISISPGSLKNQVPLFDSVNTGRRMYDFHFNSKPSPCVNKGVDIAGITRDLDSNIRVVGAAPDLGCYEKQ